MQKETLFALAERLHILLRAQGLRSCGLMRLSVMLRFLAGKSYLDLALTHQQSIPSVYSDIETTMDARDKSFKLRFLYEYETWLARSSIGFSRNHRSAIIGCCAALDGIAIKIPGPSLNDVANPWTYCNRKGVFELNVQVLCDSTYRFLQISALTPGSMHHSTAFEMSALSAPLKCEDGGISGGSWIAGDEAYLCSRQLACPWPVRSFP